MTGLSFPVICGAVLVFQAVLYTPVLPSVTPDVDFELRYNDEPDRDNLLYNVASETTQTRLKRQVTVPPDVVADKSLLNKNGLTNTKKPLGDTNVPVSTGPTVQPQDGTNSNPASSSTNGASASLPTQPPTSVGIDNNNSNGATSDGNKPVDLADADVVFDGNSTYPYVPNNSTYYNQRNVTITKVETYKYYTVHSDTDGVRKYWINMDDPKAKKHEMLSNAHRRAATVKPLFPIMFYGHQIPNLTVATGGFIYLGDQVHAWLAATQYVAPLMANFDSSTSINATVNYLSTDDFFTVEWNQVRLQDSPKDGPFTFQTTLYRNGTIVFVYKSIPIPVSAINDTNHPVKVGLSDAYIKDKNMLFVRQKTIYEYDRVDLKSHRNVTITSGTAIIFTPFTTCHELSKCEECTLARLQYKCFWCPTANKCSSGTDRMYQDWTQKGCDKPNGNFSVYPQCSTQRIDPPGTYNVNTHNDLDHDDDHDHHSSDFTGGPYIKKVKAPESEGMSAAGVIGVMFLMMLVFGAVGWLAYAYFFPHSPSGQMLIRYRPSQWAFRRGEARYTAASIHM